MTDETKKRTSTSGNRRSMLANATSSGAPRFCSLKSVRNSCPSGSEDSEPSISRLTEKAWPARIDRARKSSASGSCSSNSAKRRRRLKLAYAYGSEAPAAPRTALLSPENTRKLNFHPTATPITAPTAIPMSNWPRDQFSPACCSNVSKGRAALSRATIRSSESGLCGSTRILVSASSSTGLPLLVRSMPETRFVRCASRTFSPIEVANSTTAKITKNRNQKRGGIGLSLGDLHVGLEDRGRQLHSGGPQPFVKLGTNAGGAESPRNSPVFSYTGLFECEYVLHGDRVALHADAFGNCADPAATVAEARDLDE